MADQEKLRLGVNIDHVATVRNARGGAYPDPLRAAKIAEKSMISATVVKECVNRAYEVPLSEGLLFERRMFHSLFNTEDQKEGMSAFLEKREAQFRDK